MAALVLPSCGGGDPQPSQPSPPARLQQQQPGDEGDAGDEEAIRYRITVRATQGQTTVEPPAIASFLPADIRILNRTRREAEVRVAGVGRRTVAKDATAMLSTPGLKSGRYRIEAPGGDAVLTVRAGG